MEDNIEQTQEENTATGADSIKTTISSSESVEEITTKQEENIVANQPPEVNEATYSIQDFIDNAKALGYRKEVVAGALFNCEKSELTRTEFETLIKNFLGKKVE